jgi:2'-5' RNA ligase
MALLGISIPTASARLLADLDVPGERTGVHEMHITILLFEDNFPIAEIAKSLEAAYDIIKKTEPFTVKIKKIISFEPKEGKPHPVVALVESDELHDLCQKLRRKFNKEDIEFDKTFKKYNPHITLSYADKEIKPFKIDPVEISVQELVLLGGNHGDSRIFITFPLKSPEKHGMLLRKCELLEKFAAHWTIETDFIKSRDSFYAMEHPDLLDAVLEFFRRWKNLLELRPTEVRALGNKVLNNLKWDGWDVGAKFSAWLKQLETINPSFSQTVKDNVIREATEPLNVTDVIELEQLFTPEQMKGLLEKLIQRLTNGTEKEVERGLDDLAVLANYSTKLPHNLLMRLLRQFDPNRFAKQYGLDRGWDASFHSVDTWKARTDEFLQKPKYDTSDIIWFIEKFNDLVRYQDFLNIIGRSTDPAKRLLQSVLWATGERKDPDTLFILDPNMEFITIDANGNQSKPTFTPETMIGRALQQSGVGEGASPFETLMHDYKIIPYPKTFNHATDIMEWAREQ